MGILPIVENEEFYLWSSGLVSRN